MNRRGQALVEFILILPIFIFILFIIVDFGNIFYSKYELQNSSTDIVRMVQSNSLEDAFSYYDKLDIKVSDYKDNYKKIEVTKKIRILTPFMDKILGNPYLVKVERVIPNEED